MSFKSIIDVIKLLPQLWAIYLQIIKMIEKKKLEKEKQELSKKIENIQEAKTDEQVKDAFRDMFK